MGSRREGGRGTATFGVRQSPDAVGDRSFEQLYRVTYGPLVRLCRGIGGRQCDPEAMAQEAFIRAWLSWDRYAPEQPFWPWVATIARRLCLNLAVKRTTRDAVFHKVVATLDPPFSTDDTAERLARATAVRQALDCLSDRERRLLLLRDLEGWTYDDLALVDGSTHDSIAGRLKRARAKFRAGYQDVVGGALGTLGWRIRQLAEQWAMAVEGRLAGTSMLAVALTGLLLFPPSSSTPARARPDDAPTAAAASSLATAPMAAASTSAAALRPAAGRKLGPTPRASSGTDIGSFDPSTPASLQFTPSPSYEDDHTVFATGSASGCGADEPICGVLLKSTDGGATWTRQPAHAWDFGGLLLPPSYPRDPRIFSYSPTLLSVSDDGGIDFHPLVPLAQGVMGPATMSPSFSSGDPRILFGNAPPYFASNAVEYHDDIRLVRPLALGLPPDIVPSNFVFSPSYAQDGTVLVPAVRAPLAGSTSLTPGLWWQSGVFRCDRDRCTDVLDTDQGVAPPMLVWSAGPRSVVFARSAFGLYRSTDGGRSFSSIPLPGWSASHMDELATGPDSRVYAVSSTPVGKSVNTSLYTSDDDGNTWTLLREMDDGWLTGLTVLPDGAVLMSGTGSKGMLGIQCSVDGGRTWAPRCRRPAA